MTCHLQINCGKGVRLERNNGVRDDLDFRTPIPAGESLLLQRGESNFFRGRYIPGQQFGFRLAPWQAIKRP